jgi:hypothetical protein
MGKKQTVRREKAFLLILVKKGERMRRITDAMIKGRWDNQSCNTQ